MLSSSDEEPFDLPEAEVAKLEARIADADRGDVVPASSVLDQLRPPLVIPMHYFGPNVLARFVAKAGDRFAVRMSDVPFVTVSRATLPARPELLVLPGH